MRIPPVRVAEREEEAVSPHLQKVAALADVILYEDDHILVLNKPSGTAVHGGSGLSFGVIEGLRALRPEARFLELVHRLDRDTSGVLLVAKKRSALRSLHEQLREKGMQKDYLALGARSVAVACEERSSAVIEKYSAKRRTYRGVSVRKANRRKHALKWKNAMHLPPWCVVAR
ncbi:23S rRNA pseudouridylate synthase C [Escherichia coli]|uniref:23S rRNA pseudouridylate synthase C n=1 Tax=Escherichia coli TaxID=562 RepID=A0A376KXN7_ECOLX|nr:23S rRNA pseudouridylate synthase C [Escherichia coli]